MKRSILTLGLVSCIALFSCSDDEEKVKVKVLADDTAQEMISSDGFYVVNEDWFGHDDGTVNYFKKNADQYDISYRVYRAANPNETLGTTTCYGAIWGDHFYFVSKQGNRLVVADRKNLKKQTVLTEIGGDGRSFLGIDDRKAYISLDGGITTFSLENNSIGKKLEGVTEQVGSMVFSKGKVFAVSRSNIYIIDAAEDKVIKSIAGSYRQLTMDRNGYVWVASEKEFIKIDASTLAAETVSYPENGAPSDVWGAWNAGSLCASLTSNTIYWAAGGGMFGGANRFFMMNLDTKESKQIYALGNNAAGKGMEIYGAGLRVDPLTGELIIQAKQKGWGDNGKFNYIYKLDAEGKEITHFDVLDKNDEAYFWFPSMPVFQDENKPQILLNQVILSNNEKVEINLEEKIVDYDNIFSAMVITAASSNEKLAMLSVNDGVLTVEPGIEKGIATADITVISNGVKVVKTIQLVNE